MVCVEDAVSKVESTTQVGTQSRQDGRGFFIGHVGTNPKSKNDGQFERACTVVSTEPWMDYERVAGALVTVLCTI